MRYILYDEPIFYENGITDGKTIRISDKEAIERQKQAIELARNKPWTYFYKDEEALLEDYMIIHWAWFEEEV